MYASIQKIRDFINEPRRRYILSKDQALWHQCCSCLDAVEDSESAIAAYSAGEFDLPPIIIPLVELVP
jgi:hypothetical protein